MTQSLQNDRRSEGFRRVGLIGAGTIGSALLTELAARRDVEIDYVLVREQELEAVRALAPGRRVITQFPEALERGVDLIIEAANPVVLAAVAKVGLAGSDICGFSCGALAVSEVEKGIRDACRTSGRRFYLPHGAILALDGIADARDILDEVSIETIKGPRSLGLPAGTDAIVFDGNAREACMEFPRNVNVHAAVALAGIGFDRTKSRIVCDPQTSDNTHRIEVKGPGLQWRIEVSSHSLGGVSGAYTPVSAVGSLRRILGGNGLLIV